MQKEFDDYSDLESNTLINWIERIDEVVKNFYSENAWNDDFTIFEPERIILIVHIKLKSLKIELLLKYIVDAKKTKVSNKKLIYKIGLALFLLVLLSLVIVLTQDYLPMYIAKPEIIKLKFSSILIFVVYIGATLAITSFLNRFEPQLKIIKIISYTALLFFSTTLTFIIVQDIFIYNDFTVSTFSRHLKATVLIGITIFFVSNIKIHKLRKKDTAYSWIFFVGFLFSVGLLGMYFSDY